MPQVLFYSLVSVVMVSLIPLVGIAALFSKKRRPMLVFILVSLAVGALVGDVFLHLIPEIAADSDNMIKSSLYIIGGVLIFFVLEKFLHWKHGHTTEHDVHCPGPKCKKIQPVGYMVLVSDGLHNFIDGAVIAVSYLASFEVGVATTIAVILHEIPQEMGDIGILLHAGFTRVSALFLNVLSGLVAVLGALLALALSGVTEGFVAVILPLAAGGFIYIAGSDLVPELQKTTEIKKSLWQFVAIALGISVMYLLVLWE